MKYITFFTAIISSFTKIAVNHNVAMTGEITLRGHVTEIGGLKDKLLAAKRGMMKTVLIPAKNEKDLTEVPEEIKTELQILSVENMDTVLERALECVPISVSDPEDDNKDERKLSEEESLVPQQKGNLTEPPFEVPNFPQH